MSLLPLSEANMRLTTNDNDFAKDKHHVFYSNGTGKSAHKTMPDYMRHLEKPVNMIDPSKNLKAGETLFIVSRNQGWITVD
jgi:hypothetical protein